MTSRKDYPYSEAEKDLYTFLERVIQDQEVLSEIEKILNETRANQCLPMRGIHKKLMEYRKSSGNYIEFTQQERKMIEDLLFFWG